MSRNGSFDFAETTSIGIRRVKMERTILPRRKRKVMIPLGEVEVKICGPEGARNAIRSMKAWRKFAERLEFLMQKPTRWQ